METKTTFAQQVDKLKHNFLAFFNLVFSKVAAPFDIHDSV
jgi:hypothetical protein